MNTQKRNVIKGFGRLTRQQVLEMSVAHVLKNGRPSMKWGSCSYAGIGCGAAPFLTAEARDTLYGSWGALVESCYVPSHNRSLIQQLQHCHDTSTVVGMSNEEFIPKYKRRIRVLVEKEGDLKMPKGVES